MVRLIILSFVFIVYIFFGEYIWSEKSFVNLGI